MAYGPEKLFDNFEAGADKEFSEYRLGPFVTWKGPTYKLGFDRDIYGRFPKLLFPKMGKSISGPVLL